MSPSLPGILVAGGASSRFIGADKRTATVGGVRLVDLAAQALSPCEPLVAIGPELPATVHTPERLIWVSEPDRQGPVWAATRALEHIRATNTHPINDSGWFLLSGVDTPFTAEVFARLAQLVRAESPADALVAQDDQLQPLIAAYRIQPFLTHARPEGSFRHLLQHLHIQPVPITPQAAAGCNTHAQLHQARRRVLGLPATPSPS